MEGMIILFGIMCLFWLFGEARKYWRLYWAYKRAQYEHERLNDQELLKRIHGKEKPLQSNEGLTERLLEGNRNRVERDEVHRAAKEELGIDLDEEST